MEDEFLYDVFLSYSSKDKKIVLAIANRLKRDGVRVWLDDWILKPGDNIPAKIEEGLEYSRLLVLCMSANAFGSDWAQLESQTFRFRDPLNKKRRFLPLRLDTTPIKGSLVQFVYISWLNSNRGKEYARMLDACLNSTKDNDVKIVSTKKIKKKSAAHQYKLGINSVQAYAFSSDGKCVLASAEGGEVSLWDLGTGIRIRNFEGHERYVKGLTWSIEQEWFISCSSSGGFDDFKDKNNLLLWEVKTGYCIQALEGHKGMIYTALLDNQKQRAISCSLDKTIRLWDLESGDCITTFEGHTAHVYHVAWSADERHLVSCSYDQTIRLWDVDTGKSLYVFEGHTSLIYRIAYSRNQRFVLSGDDSGVIILWEIQTGGRQVLKGHTKIITALAFHENNRWALSGSNDKEVRVWDTHTGQCIYKFQGRQSEIRDVAWSTDGKSALAGDANGLILSWDLSELINDSKVPNFRATTTSIESDQIDYTNAKVLVVGDTNAGKTGLTHRLATGEWKPSDASTVGAWSTQFSLKAGGTSQKVDREIWLWDFGGQADQRLIHQLYMDRTALILQLFNADQEDVLPGLRDWQTALRRCVKEKIPHFLVAGRIDTGFKASREKLQTFAKEHGLAYHETSAKEGTGCDKLRTAMISEIPWSQMEKRTSPRIFKLIKDEILKLRDEGQVLHTFKELRDLLWQRLPEEPRFTDETLQTVIVLLDGPGVVTELEYGTYILLAPEWINAYAQAVIRTLRSAENDLGVLPLRSIAEGKLIYQSIGRDGIPVEMKRLSTIEERVVLGEMERQLEQRGLCLRQGDKLVFPSHCGRDRPAVLKHPSVFVSYVVKGFLDDIYATLVVKLADSQSFHLKELWRDAADFVTLTGDHHMGIKLTRQSGSDGSISVYFGKGVTQEEQVIFANYIHRHLEGACELAVRLRHYVCPKCYTPKGNPEVLMKKLLEKKQLADTECDGCETRFPLWDALEQKFASQEVRKQVEELQADDLANLTSRRKGKLLVLDVGARITSANQKWIEVPGDEDDGIDIMLEFTNEEGNGVGKGLCLQLKAGNSFLKTRKSDGSEIFTIKKPRWIETWINQPYPVMLVIGTFSAHNEKTIGDQKIEFADVRWMEISSVLRRESENGARPVKQIEFKGERLDITSIRKWREKILDEK